MAIASLVRRRSARLTRGDLVQIRSLDEISQTLDEHGQLDGLPFMPEMNQFCGAEARISARMEKICVEHPRFQFRMLPNVVILEGLECSGEDHGGCQRSCALLWQEAWLRPKGDGHDATEVGSATKASSAFLPVRRLDGRYICQSSELPLATQEPDPRFFFRWFSEFSSGNLPLSKAILRVISPLWRKAHAFLTRTAVWQVRGTAGKPAEGSLGLQPGDFVEVRSLGEIRQTLNPKSKHKGLSFTRIMASFCGRRFRVKSRVETIVLEGSGETRCLKDTVILEDVKCDGCIFPGGCSRQAYHFWREIWLRRVQD